MRPAALFVLAVLVPLSARAAEPFASLKVQAPELAAPERGSVAGQLARVAFGPADVGRGEFSLATPFSAPQERGPLLGTALPSYSIEGGLSEWGMGWQSSLTITRGRLSGDLDYSTDDLNGPWGRMVQGDDGAFYPVGLRTLVRVEENLDVLVAYLPDGSTWTFGGANRVTNAKGTYSWYLSEAVNSLGRRTAFEYDRNASGRLFLSHISYGGRGDELPYRVDLAYQTVTGVADYRSGSKLQLDRRVKTVTMLAKSRLEGDLRERWRYDLLYDQDAQSPAFYLREIRQIFASGEAAPPIRYSYRRPSEYLASAATRRVPRLDDLLSQYGTDVVQPDRTANLDYDLDGRADLELGSNQQLLLQSDAGFTAQDLPPPDEATDPRCRPPAFALNSPRALAQLRASDPTFQVLATVADAMLLHTDVVACERDGRPLATASLDGNWQLGAGAKLVDLNRDHQPDLLHVVSGSYQIALNQSTADGVAFSAPIQGTLTPSVPVVGVWGQDFNGDGIVDLVVRTGGALRVWFGLGGLQFAQPGQLFQFTNFLGPVSIAPSDEITFVDANRDGLSDVLLTTSNGSLSLYVNRGGDLRLTSVPGFGSLPSWSGRPVVADLVGSGNSEVVLSSGGVGYALAVDAPSVGLMISADDGRGTRLAFEYDRAPPVAGARSRQTVLSALEVTSAGLDTVRYTYEYSAPRLHSIGRFLLGFDDVVRRSPTSVQSMNFLNEDRYSAVELFARTHDPVLTAFDRIEQNLYDETTLHGIPRKRLKETLSGWAAPGPIDVPALLTRTEYLAYEDEICPVEIRVTNQQGTKLTERHRLQLPRFASHALCLYADTTISGEHADPTLDFHHEAHLFYDDDGQLLRVESVTPEETLVLQEASYVDTRLSTLGSPGLGVTSYDYEPGTDLLRQVIAPDGHSVFTERDPVTDAITHLSTSRGAASYEQFFRSDGQERLQKVWNNLLNANESAPNQSYTYQYANATRPGLIQTSKLIDAQQGTYARIAEFFAADGDELTTASQIPEGLTFTDLAERKPSLGQTLRHFRPPLGDITPAQIDLATLFGSTTLLGSRTVDAFGEESGALERYHADVTQSSLTSFALTEQGLERTTTENGIFTEVSYLDASKRVTRFRDTSGAETSYVYDVLGRVRRVNLPDGNVHELLVDGHGRTSEIRRSEIETISYGYAPVTGLLATQTIWAPNGSGVREERLSYDDIGRVAERTMVDLVSGRSDSYRFYYDGFSPSSPPLENELGFMTGVEGLGFSKSFQHRVDGALLHRDIALSGWRTISTDFEYEEDGSTRGRSVMVRNEDGSVVLTSSQSVVRDPYGRAQSLLQDGATLASYSYASDGKPESVALPGASATFLFEDFAHQAVGFEQTQSAQNWSARTTQHKNDRGLVDQEQITVGPTDAATTLNRSYSYTSQGFLQSSSDAASNYAYSYGATGLLTSAAHEAVYDSVGRLIERDGVSMTYGPGGDIASATSGSSYWSYVYDELGKRLAKLVDDVPVAAYLEEGYLTAWDLTEPTRFGGRLLGVVRNGAFILLAADARGTVFADSDGTPHLASPYGERDDHPDFAEAIDFVAAGYDRDLGTVRFGARDYDPTLGRFVRPDPLFLAAPEKCVASPVECNLYSYAKNDPLGFIDPTGMQAVDGGVDGPDGGVDAARDAAPDAAPETDSLTPAREANQAAEDRSKTLGQLNRIGNVNQWTGLGLSVAAKAPEWRIAWLASRDPAKYTALTVRNMRMVGNITYAKFMVEHKLVPLTTLRTLDRTVGRFGLAPIGVALDATQGVYHLQMGNNFRAGNSFLDAGLGVLTIAVPEIGIPVAAVVIVKNAAIDTIDTTSTMVHQEFQSSYRPNPQGWNIMPLGTALRGLGF